MLELVSPGAHLWSLDVDGWHIIPCRQNLDAALIQYSAGPLNDSEVII